MVKRVITYGTFDLFHFGHVRVLQRLRALGDELHVGCATDAFNAKKGKQSVIPFGERLEVLAACRYVDHVFAEEDWSQKPADIAKYNIDVFGMGDDWAGKFDALRAHCEVVYLPRTDEISTTRLLNIIHASPKR
jgi:glycerol-3-phosphate cytidylyltransferase